MFMVWKKTAASFVFKYEDEESGGAHMRKILLALAFMTATAATPALGESLAPATAQAATLSAGGPLSAGATVMNSRKKHRKQAKKNLHKNGSNSKHRT